jgi:membrane associated rhomboid family serine protease
MFPLHDDNPTRTTPVVTIGLIVANVVGFLYQLNLGLSDSVIAYGLVPAALFHGDPMAVVSRSGGGVVQTLSPPWLSLFTSMFMHGGWLHLLGNMWFLWIFGNNVEDEMGKGKFLGFYLLCGLGAAAAQIALGPQVKIPMVGASGAIAGVLGAYLVLFPGSRVLCLVTAFIFITTMELPASIVLGYWLVINVFSTLGGLGNLNQGGTAFAAHVGGFALGWLLVRWLGANRRPPPRAYRPEPEGRYIDWR